MSRVLTRCRSQVVRRHADLAKSALANSGAGGLHRPSAYASSSNTGYIVLLPEVPPDTPETNQLLKVQENPKFDKLTKQNYLNAVGKLALELESNIWRLEEKLKDPKCPKTYDEVLEPLESASASFDYAWSVLKTLNLVKNNFFPSEGYNQIHERARIARSKKYVSLPIYFACKEIKVDAEKLNEPQQRVIDKFLLEGSLSGAELTGSASIQLGQTIEKLNAERSKFSKNVEISTSGFRHLIVEPKYVGEMPAFQLKRIAKDKSQPQKGPWIVTLSDPIYKSFLEYCPEAAIRWNAWNAYNTRASSYTDKNTDNSVHIEEIRSKRQEQAKLLGFENYVELSMQTKMAGCEDTVQTMLATLFTHARPKQLEEFEELKSFAASRGFEGLLRPWDVDFWRRKQRTSLFSVDDDIVSEYFPFPKVWKSLCGFAQELFGIQIKRTDAPGWHEDVLYFEVFDQNSRQKLGGFYVDPYSRSDEKLGNNSWVLGNRTLCGVPEIKPLATVVLNFPQPLYGKPSLLSFDDMHTLFSKFGQVLQHVLTTIPYHEVSGTNNIEWDAVFISQKFMTMWLGNKSIIKEMSSHFENGSKMTDGMITNLLRSRKHMAAFDLCHQLYLSALDIDLYTKKEFWVDIVKNLWPVYHDPLQLDKRDSHLCSMVDIFSGDLAAAYYSRLWSQMLAADAYQKFVEKGQGREAWKAHGQRFRESILSMGGGYHPNKVFRQFRGRDPSMDAILWTLGLKPMTVVEGEGNAAMTEATKNNPHSVKAAN